MKLTFFGAASEVGRSCIMLEGADTKILLDTGVKLGSTVEYPKINDDELRDVDAIVISHAHLDHSGYLAHIYSTDFQGMVYATKPTIELANVLVNDYLKISNPANVTKDWLHRIQKAFRIIDYHKEFKIKGLTVRLVPAGHILGSAMIEAYDGRNRLLYTGDLNLRSTKLLEPAEDRDFKVDTLITESTYAGDKDAFPTEKKVMDDMVTSINDTIKRGGKVVIPSFGVGRAQEVMLLLDDYMKSGRLEHVPIYMDGMIGKAMRIHRHNVIYCRDELQKRILMNDDDPFKSTNFKTVRTKSERSHIMGDDQSSIIVTTGGMMTGGPIVKYMERMGRDEMNKLILVGYQAAGTPGRAILEGAKEVMIADRRVTVGMQVERYHLSAHADRQQLATFIAHMHLLRNIYIVHGEKSKSMEFNNYLKKKYNSNVPEIGSTYTI